MIPAVPLPVGAVDTEEWQPNGDDRFYRFFEGETHDIATESKHSPRIIGVFGHAAMYHDGAIDDGTRKDTGIVLSSSAWSLGGWGGVG